DSSLQEVVVTANSMSMVKREILGYTQLSGKASGLMISSVGKKYKLPLADDFNTEEYDNISENGFHRVTDDPLSTFSIDVDAASYSNVRRYINNNELPPAGAVRTEEMINYFKYQYPQPAGKDPFSINT